MPNVCLWKVPRTDRRQSLGYYIGHAVYMLRFHPLAKIPGPRINAISRLPFVRHLLKGTTAENVKQLHEQYGDVVRVTPNEISFISGETAWPQIAGFRTGDLKGHQNMQKDPVWYAPSPNGIPSILVANDEAHSRGRRVLSHAFSERALHEQEPLLQGYVDLLISQLMKVASTSKAPRNLAEYYNWTTFDIIADLLFGEPFGCLKDLQTHEYVQLLFNTIEAGRLHYILSYFPWMKRFGSFFIDTSLIDKRVEYHKWMRSQTQKRIAKKTDRPDFMAHILKHNGEKGLSMSEDEMVSNASLVSHFQRVPILYKADKFGRSPLPALRPPLPCLTASPIFSLRIPLFTRSSRMMSADAGRRTTRSPSSKSTAQHILLRS